MYAILTPTYIPYEYTSVKQVVRHIEDCCQGIKHGLRLIEKDTEHLIVRCPVSGDYLGITASTPEEIAILDREIKRRNLYRP